MIERTFVMVKTDGVQRGIVGDIISRLEKTGLKLIGLKMKWVDEDFAKEHYAEHKEKDFFAPLVNFLKEGPVVAMVFEGVESVELVRKIVGGTEPKTALPGTIRGDYAHVSYGHADKKKIAIKNLIHASANKEDAEKEVLLWFAVDELYQYKNLHETHTME